VAVTFSIAPLQYGHRGLTEKVLTSLKRRFAAFAGRVSVRKPPHKHHLQPAQQNNVSKSPASILYRKNYKMSYPIFASILLLRAYALAPEKDSEIVRKYWKIWKIAPE
jgi:hypothetical protein